MPLFSVPIILQRKIDSYFPEPLFQESIFLVEALDHESASEKAKTYARAEECSYLNSEGEKVSWTIVGTGNPFEILSEIKEGTEVYSRFLSDPGTRDDGN